MTNPTLVHTNRLTITALLAGLAMTVIATIVAYVNRGALIDHIRAGYPTETPTRINTAANTYLALLTVVGGVGVVGWLWTIRAVYLDRSWVRVAATALFTLGVAIALTALLTKDTSGDVGLPPSFGWLVTLPCLPGLLAVAVLWRRR